MEDLFVSSREDTGEAKIGKEKKDESLNYCNVIWPILVPSLSLYPPSTINTKNPSKIREKQKQ
jgi:hypothetical protein